MNKEQKIILEDFFERQTLQMADGIELLSCLIEISKMAAKVDGISEEQLGPKLNQLLARVELLNFQDNGKLTVEALLNLVNSLKQASEK